MACGGQPAPSKGASLGGDVARVGATSVPAALLSGLSRASGDAPRKVLEGVVEDSLVASAVRGPGAASPLPGGFSTDASLARRLVRAIATESAAEGPPKPDELQSARVVHACVLRSTRVPEARAVAVAGAIRRAVDGARSADEFMARAGATPHADTQVRIEPLPPFLADGLSVSGEGGEIDASFVAAAFGLRGPAQVSPVVETRFGWHVIFLVERGPADTSSDPERATTLARAIEAMRVRARIESLLRARAQRVPVEVSSAAEALMAEVTLP